MRLATASFHSLITCSFLTSLLLKISFRTPKTHTYLDTTYLLNNTQLHITSPIYQSLFIMSYQSLYNQSTYAERFIRWEQQITIGLPGGDEGLVACHLQRPLIGRNKASELSSALAEGHARNFSPSPPQPKMAVLSPPSVLFLVGKQTFPY